MKYSQNAWKQLIQRIQGIPETELRSDERGDMVKCRKHTDLVMKALKETARSKGYVTFYMFLQLGCK